MQEYQPQGGEKSMLRFDDAFEDEIRAEAREIYERSGRVEGRDLDNWAEAERTVFARHSEYLRQEYEDTRFTGMPFEVSE